MTEHRPLEPTPSRERSTGWREQFEQALQVVLTRPDLTIRGVADVVWLYGFLERLAPSSLMVQAERDREQKWCFDQSDPDFYQRILTAIAAHRYATAQGWSMILNNWMQPIVTAAMKSADSGRFEKYTPMKLFDEITDVITQQADEVLAILNPAAPPFRLPAFGTAGRFKGIPVKFERIDSDARIWLDVDASVATNGLEAHTKLGELTNHQGVTPAVFVANFEPSQPETS